MPAPVYIIVQVELVDSDGVPLSGVDLNSFSFQVGAEDVGDDDIVASYAILGQQWFDIRAPVQDNTAVDQYDLHAKYGALSGEQQQAVRYTRREDADNVLLIDHSGSMAEILRKPPGCPQTPLACSLIVAAPVTRSASSASTT